ncbi:GntR family transcriptional regulator [Sciscionella marina]|uniref:GntR family transcriptional regulator n=1 Tax=Sciscionella marina TaxID=508770 RepID=UPI00036115F9|nr:GntR family transcriptional regulator [Sciscionella marina]
MGVQKVDRPPSLTELAYGQLRNGILSGDLAAGTRLSVVSLASEMGMSRSPVRAAIERLATDGLMRLAPGGAMVLAPDCGDLLEALAVRGTLEGLAARLAAPQLKDTDLASLAQIHDQFRMAVEQDDTHTARQADLEFHRQVQLRCGNSCLVEHLDRVQARVILATYSTAWSPQQHQAVTEHAEILAALESRDGAAAGQLATAHIEHLIERIRVKWRH